MCGIAGELRFDARSPDPAAVERMLKVMAPRGPDAQGLHSQRQMCFGHRRLSIIDLSVRADQPLLDPELGLVLVFNGCIYNYPELRKELVDLGYRFFSSGDSEVVLKAYHAWGERCVERFMGMFAFVIWERDSACSFLARDRLGIKPLYLNDQPGSLRFASSLPALLAGGGVDTGLDLEALNFYMNFHAVVPAPWTLLRGVRKLPPATWMRIDADAKRTQKCYWEVSYQTPEDQRSLGLEDWKQQVLDALRLAVKRRLVADVPVGVLLSGGVDSSLIVGLLAEQGQSGLNTFSVGFETVGDEIGDEFEYSDLIAEHYQTQHHRIRVDSGARLLPNLPDCVAAMNEPMVSHDAIGFYLLSQEVSRHVKVVQSGQGADEVFGGYHWYPPMLESRDPVADYGNAFCDRSEDEYLATLTAPFHSLGVARRFIADEFARPGAADPAALALRMDTHVMLVDDPVKRVDSMTMAWGLEARVPFLDHQLVELAARIPSRFKIDQGGKYVLKEAAREVIPAAVIDRRKGYFPVPALKYLRGDVLEFVRGVLDSQAARERGLFERRYVERLLAEPDAHITPLKGSKLWQLAVLELWLQRNGI